MQSIITEYKGPTNKRGSRIIATASGLIGKQGAAISAETRRALRMSIPYDNLHGNKHGAAAKALAERLGWDGLWIEGDLGGSRMVYVHADTADGAMPAKRFHVVAKVDTAR